MNSTIFQAPAYDPKRERRKRIIIAAIVLVAVIAGALGYHFRNIVYERKVSQFFTSLQEKNFETAYSIWMADPDWKQHSERYKRYPFSEFYRDWGPGGEWGLINTFDVEGSTNSGGSGIVVRVRVNARAQRADVWVEKRDKTLTFSPYPTIQ